MRVPRSLSGQPPGRVRRNLTVLRLRKPSRPGKPSREYRALRIADRRTKDVGQRRRRIGAAVSGAFVPRSVPSFALGLALGLALDLTLLPAAPGAAAQDGDRTWLPLGLSFSPYDHSPKAGSEKRNLTGTQFAALSGGASGARAQVAQARAVERGETVETRSRPAWDPLGIRLGAFVLFPSLTLRETFTDNVFADTGDRRADLITQVQPAVSLRSGWSRHSLTFDAGGDIGFFADNSDEDFEDFFFGSAGRLDLRRDTVAKASAEYRNAHENRGSPDDVNGDEPTEIDNVTVATGILHRFGRFSVGADGELRRLDFGDVTATTAAGVPFVINNDDRDRDIYTATGRLGYEIQPSYQAFVLGSGNWRRYDQAVDDNGFQRDSDGFSIAAGVRLDLGGVIFGDLFAGYTRQSFDDPTFGTVQGADFGADMTWTVTPLTTISGTASRTVEDTTIVGASGFFRNEAGLSVDHELLRNLILGVEGRYSLDDYQDISREDRNIALGADARYLLNRNIYLSLGYNFRHRESTVAADFAENTALLSLRAQY